VVCFATALRFSAFISLGALLSGDRKTKSGIQEKVMAFESDDLAAMLCQPLAFMVLSQTGFCASTTLALRWFQ